jgi:hypothetical protein
MNVCPIGRLFVLRMTAPLSNTMTVLPSSRNGWAWLPASAGKLRIVTPTSKQTGLERADCPEALSEFWEDVPGLPGLLDSGKLLIVSVMAFGS